MLETTLATSFVPGTNLKGKVAGANWSFLLPNLALEQVVCLGAPLPTTLATLSRLSQQVIVVDAGSRRMPELMSEASQQSGLTNIYPVATNGKPEFPLPDSSADLIVIVGRRNTQRLGHNRAIQQELQRLLKPAGIIYFEFGGLVDWMLGGRTMDNFVQGFSERCMLWLTPITGEMHTAVPLDDRDTINFFLHHELYSPAVRLRLFDRAERFLNKRLFSSRPARRYGVLVAQGDITPLDQPPRYLRSIAQQAGVNIDQYRWGLSARGQYSTRKLLFFLFNRKNTSPDSPPEYIVKMVRDPAFNARLENEYRALSWLYGHGIGDRESLPQAVFFGHHNDLAVVGESMIEGVPFRRQTKATADCPYGRFAIDWLVKLGVATANPAAATPAEVAEGLMKLFTQFRQVYRLTPAQHTFLNEQIATIGRSREPLPLVFQHGDPGTWNVMVTPTGRTVFLDWEAAEPQGMPLWDLFYFMRSYAVWSARLNGTRNSLKGFRQQLLADSPLGQLLVEVTGRYCQQTGVPRHLVEPLFYTCWMHRALKEATRRPPARLEHCHYVNLLRLCIEQRHAPLFDRLFS